MNSDDLRAIMEQTGLTPGTLAEMLGVERRSIYRWLDGTHAVPPMVASILQLLKRKRFSTASFKQAREGERGT